ncbi:hypothetical protein [Stieleria mannarensis]|uniref:hypothetical protein n=1 Tax=Stieleria mannarensis TaxID=2755585 RepID=UPI0025700338|nr:hypothetical protein [Rhodopirellula sp. JC639]
MNSKLLLREDAIIKTVAALHQRISDRFPGSGLSNLCTQLLEVAEKSAVRAQGIGESVWWIRICGYVLALLVIALVGGMVWFTTHSVRFKDEAIGWPDLIGTFDAGTSGLIVLGATIYFLISLEIRIKRRRALIAVHELRSIAHVVDMHQLTKDPERMLRRYRQTQNSPAEAMSPMELSRYLDYCTEMLSLIGKIAALYVQRFDDAASVAAVSEVEQLTTGLSRKIWQKIVLLSDINEFQTRHVRVDPPEEKPDTTAPPNVEPM